MHASEAAIEAVIVDLICLIRASAMEKMLFIFCVFVFVFQFLLFDHVVSPKCTVLDPFNLKTNKNYTIVLNLGQHTFFKLLNTHYSSLSVLSYCNDTVAG